MSSNTSEREGAREFMQVRGFTRASDLGMSPAKIAEYEQFGMTAPKPGEYYQNNGIIAAATSSGDIVVWISKEDPNAPREVPHKQAIENLKINGYTERNFGVPSFKVSHYNS